MHTYITDHECAEVSTIEFFIKKESQFKRVRPSLQFYDGSIQFMSS
jgi:hypothetical protein